MNGFKKCFDRFNSCMIVFSLYESCLCTMLQLDRSVFISTSNLAQLEFFKLAKDNFTQSGMDQAMDSPDIAGFFEEQAEIYVRDWILRFQARV